MIEMVPRGRDSISGDRMNPVALGRYSLQDGHSFAFPRPFLAQAMELNSGTTDRRAARETAATVDAALLDRVAAGDREAFEALYHRYHSPLFAYIFRLSRRGDMVEDILNDVLFAVWKGASRFAGRSQPSTWIFGIAHHQTMRALRRLEPRRQDARAPEAIPADGGWPEPAATEGPESLLDRRELGSTLSRALASLSPEQRAVVELTYYHEFSYQEIAETLDCPVNTVKTRMFHARRRLRSLLPALGISGHAG
jgi:RNA polymerase sigma factor (sigma-70 family)